MCCVVPHTYTGLINCYPSDSISTSLLLLLRDTNLLLQDVLRLVRKLVQVVLVRQEQLEVHDLLIQKHACDLAAVLFAKRSLDRLVDQVADFLTALILVLDLVAQCDAVLWRQRHVNVLALVPLASGVLVLRPIAIVLRVLSVGRCLGPASTAASVVAPIIVLALAAIIATLGVLAAPILELTADLVDHSVEVLLHALFLLLIALSSKVDTGHPKLNVDGRVAKRSGFIQLLNGLLAALYCFKQHISVVESARIGVLRLYLDRDNIAELLEKLCDLSFSDVDRNVVNEEVA